MASWTLQVCQLTSGSGDSVTVVEGPSGSCQGLGQAPLVYCRSLTHILSTAVLRPSFSFLAQTSELDS